MAERESGRKKATLQREQAFWVPTKRWHNVTIVAIALTILGYAPAYWIPRIDWDAAWQLGHAPIVRVSSVVLLIVIAFGLFWVRERYPRAYAALEFLVAVTLAWLAVWPSSASSLERGTKALTAMYLMIRSMDNWRKGKENDAVNADDKT